MELINHYFTAQCVDQVVILNPTMFQHDSSDVNAIMSETAAAALLSLQGNAVHGGSSWRNYISFTKIVGRLQSILSLGEAFELPRLNRLQTIRPEHVRTTVCALIFTGGIFYRFSIFADFAYLNLRLLALFRYPLSIVLIFADDTFADGC